MKNFFAKEWFVVKTETRVKIYKTNFILTSVLLVLASAHFFIEAIKGGSLFWIIITSAMIGGGLRVIFSKDILEEKVDKFLMKHPGK